MHINFNFGNGGNSETVEAWLLNLLSAPNIHSVGHLTLTENGELLPLSQNGFPYSGADGEVTSLLQTLCTSILNGALQMWHFTPNEEFTSIEDYKLNESVNISTVYMEDGTCHMSISFSLER